MARSITGRGTPARRATWMPWLLSVGPGSTLRRKINWSFHSRTATWWLRIRANAGVRWPGTGAVGTSSPGAVAVAGEPASCAAAAGFVPSSVSSW